MPTVRRITLAFLVGIMFLALTTPIVWSQTVHGTIAGTATDTSGAIIGGVAVTLTNLSTAEKRYPNQRMTLAATRSSISCRQVIGWRPRKRALRN